MTVPMAITLTVVGLTFYAPSFEGETLACGGKYDDQHGLWAAVPIEWNKDGYVHCGDMLYATFSNGVTVTVPIRDFGCHLHYPAYDSGLPYGADFPRILGLEKVPTGTGTIAVKHKDGEWWDIPPLTAWGRQWCDGPLTKEEKRNARYPTRRLAAPK
jgi:hypothetical protein